MRILAFILTFYSWRGEDDSACAHRATTVRLNDPSKLACLLSLGRAPILVYVRPSNEALLRARVPGAQDQRGCPSNPSYRGGSAGKETMPAASLLILLFFHPPTCEHHLSALR